MSEPADQTEGKLFQLVNKLVTQADENAKATTREIARLRGQLWLVLVVVVVLALARDYAFVKFKLGSVSVETATAAK